MPLRLLLDADPAPSVVAYARELEWAHGPLTVQEAEAGAARRGLRAMWLQAFAELPGEEGHNVAGE